MAAPFTDPPLEFEDYPTSEQVYDYFEPAKLKARIVKIGNVPPDGVAAINGHLDDLLKTIDFGTVSCADHTYLTGTASDTDSYPTSSSTTARLLGYRLGKPAPAGTTLPRVVVTAGIHAREMLPPGATAKYFAQLLVNYVHSLVCTDKKLVSMEHKGFVYQSGPGLEDNAMDKSEQIKPYELPAADLRQIIEKLEIIILPVVNPGGRDFVLATPPETKEPDLKKQAARRNWRKNRRLLPAATVAATAGAGAPSTGKDARGQNVYGLGNNDAVPVRPIGADINRNANFVWDSAAYYNSNTVSRLKKFLQNSDPSSFEDYRGPGVNSEPETCAILAAMTTQSILNMPAVKDTFGTTPGLESSLPAGPFLGTLFCLDVHSALGGIYTPWGTETPSSADPKKANPAMNFTNTAQAMHDKRDGPDRNGYYEFLPSRVKFGAAPREYNLLAAHTDIAKAMQQAVTNAFRGKAVTTDKDMLERLKGRCEYEVDYVANLERTELYPVPGAALDYAVGLNIRGITDLTIKADTYTNSGRNGPVIALTMEAGRQLDGDFAPLDKVQHLRSKPPGVVNYTAQGLYSKVEREVWAALHTFLLQSITYAAGTAVKPK